MKFSFKSANRHLVAALVVGSSLGFSMTGVTHAQYDTSGQSSTGQGSSTGEGSSTSGQGSSTKPSGGDYGILKERMESGEVDQKIRNERNKGVEPSVPPPVRKDERGVPIKDPSDIQGGPIGPN